MVTCTRCGKPHPGTDSLTCAACWEEMGQMQFWQDEDQAIPVLWEDGDDGPPMDTFFDREEEARGYQ